MNITQEISFLLFKHNCVIIPEWGAFILNDKDAEVNHTTQYALPKNRIVSFNSQIKNNDGLLANHIKTVNNCSYEEGINNIASFVNEFKKELANKRNLSFDHVGTFYLTQEDKLIFVPNHVSNFNINSFGLPKIKLKTLDKPNLPLNVIKSSDNETKITPTRVYPTSPKREQVKQAKRENLQTKKTPEIVRKKNKYNLNFINLVGSFFIIAMIFSLINFELNSNSIDFSDNQNASILDTAPSKTKNSNTFSLTIETPHQIFAEVETQEEGEKLVSKLVKKYKKSELIKDNHGHFKVFIISFSNPELANEYKILLQNKMNQKLTLE